GPDVRRGRDARAATQDELAHHELAVVLADGAWYRSVAGIGRIRALRPLPHVSEELRERLVGRDNGQGMEDPALLQMPVRRRVGGGVLPLGLGGQSPSAPARVRVR